MKKVMSIAAVALFVIALSGCCSMHGRCGKTGMSQCAKPCCCCAKPATEKADM